MPQILEDNNKGYVCVYVFQIITVEEHAGTACCVHTDRQQDKSSRGYHRFTPELHTGEHVQPEEQCDRSWIFDHSEVAFRAGF